MKWQEDLVKDIRFGDQRDDLDQDWNGGAFADMPRFNVTVRDVEGSDFSKADRAFLALQLERLKSQGKLKAILEIGVENNLAGLTSTSEILRLKPDDCIYLGVDLRDLKHLDTPAKNIYTLQAYSQSWPAIYKRLDELGVKEIDFLFIDGWHSINQCLYDWEYTTRLASHGIVGFHDTAYHPGPYYFMKALDRKKWTVIENAVYDANDYGVGFAWKKHD